MSLDLPSGTRRFIDTTIVYYAFVDTPPLTEHCRHFISRLQAGDIDGFTTISVLADVVHKTMLAEASVRFARGRAGLVGWLGRRPDLVSQLSDYQDVAQRLTALRLTRLDMDAAILPEAAVVSREFGLFTNDATIVALMRRHGLTDLATNDDDFDDMPGIRVWKPR